MCSLRHATSTISASETPSVNRTGRLLFLSNCSIFRLASVSENVISPAESERTMVDFSGCSVVTPPAPEENSRMRLSHFAATVDALWLLSRMWFVRAASAEIAVT